MSIKINKFTYTSAILLAATLSLGAPAQASNVGAFLGGMLTTKVISNMSRRTEAEEQQAANSSRQVAPAPAPAPAAAPAAQSPEQRISQLDKLAAGGYITPAEYKAKKQSIIDGM
jgi:membrane protease subunit (stomatin/prohibitin family)